MPSPDDWRFRGRARAGISLLEVMFSIGVVMIGLVGIAALLPVAGVRPTRVRWPTPPRGSAPMRSASSMCARWAIRQLGGGLTRRVPPVSPVTVPELIAGNSFCLDPRFVAQGDVSSDHVRRNGFPYIDDLYPSGQFCRCRASRYLPVRRSRSNCVMGKLQANQVFTSDDNLVFDLPTDRTIGPVQNFSLAGPHRELRAPLRRSTTGNISWMATIVPKLDQMGNLTDEYTLSVVVFSRRIIDPPDQREPGERTSGRGETTFTAASPRSAAAISNWPRGVTNRRRPAAAIG